MKSEDLKRSILQIAMEGKLVPQDNNDIPAYILVDKIKKEKACIVKKNKIKNSKELDPIPTDEIPYDIPESWIWEKLGNCIILKSGQDLNKSLCNENGQGIPYIIGASNIINENFVPQRWTENPKSIGSKEDLLLSVKGTIGKTAFCQYDQIHLSRQINAIHPILLNRYYVRFFIKNMINHLKNEARSMIPGISRDHILNLSIPIPPLEEQERIVKKIEELIPYIEKYGEAEEKLEELNKTFPEKIKASVLQEAVQGKLVSQNPDDVPAKELLAQIEKEKEQLIKDKKIKRNSKESIIFRNNGHFYEKVGKKGEPVCIDNEIPFKIPYSWEWCRLGHIGDWKAGSTPNRNEPKFYENGHIPWLKTGDLNDSLIEEVPEYITGLALEKTSVRLNPKGSVLIAMYGATIGKLGILNIESTTNQACCACITFQGIYNKYLFHYLMSQRAEFKKKGEGGAQPNISRTKIVNYLFPVPPLKEQKRIVNKIEQLFEMCKKFNHIK